MTLEGEDASAPWQGRSDRCWSLDHSRRSVGVRLRQGSRSQLCRSLALQQVGAGCRLAPEPRGAGALAPSTSAGPCCHVSVTALILTCAALGPCAV